MKALLSDLRVALLAFFGVVLISFACCQPIHFIGPSPSPRWGLVSCGAAGAFLVLGFLVPVLLRIRPTLREKARERERERHRSRVEACPHGA